MKLQSKRKSFLLFTFYFLCFQQMLFSMEAGSTVTSQSMILREKLAAFYKSLKGKTVGAFVDVECLVCHEKAKVEGEHFITSVKHMLQLWSQGEVSSSDEKKWWIGLHTIGLDYKSQLASLAKWYWAGYVGHPCHLSCLAEKCMQTKIEVIMPMLLNLIKYECPLNDQKLNTQEVKIIQHYLDIAFSDWFKGKPQIKSIIDALRHLSAENPGSFNALLRITEGLKSYSLSIEHKYEGIKLYPDQVFETLAQTWVKNQLPQANLRAKERERFQPTSAAGANIEMPKPEEDKTKVADVLSAHPWLKMANQVKPAVAKDHLATFIGFQRIAEAIFQGKERICASEDLSLFLAAQSDFRTFQQFLGEPEMGVEELNPIRDEIARRWIRNAAARVFNKLLRSFLELVVNACDATNPGPSVGKFGMGFLSILQLLGYETTKGVTIVIQTMPQPDEYIHDSFPYQITIEIPGLSELPTEAERLAKWQSIDFSKDFDISVKFEKLPEDSEFIQRLDGKPTGTLISITPNTGKFTPEDLTELARYTHYLDFYEPVRTILNTSATIEEIGGTNLSPKISVNLSPTKLEVLDAGTGISLYVALFKLFIPSSSTKVSIGLLDARKKMRDAKIEDKDVRPVEFVEFKGKTDTKSHFLITVNSVVAIDVAMDQEIKIGGYTKDLLVRLPQSAQLTLARDELVMSHSVEHENDPDHNMRGKGPEEAFLNRIIDKTIAGCVDGNITSHMLQYLCSGLKEWEKQTSNMYIKDRFSSYLSEQVAQRLSGKVVAAPSEFMKKFAPEKLGAGPLPFTPIDLDEEMAGYNYGPLEQQLKDYFVGLVPESFQDTMSKLQRAGFNQELIQGMNVFFVPSGANKLLAPGEISKLGLKNSIFAPQELLDDVVGKNFASAKKYLVNKIAARFIDQDFSSQDESDDIIVFTNATDFLRPESWDRNIDFQCALDQKTFDADFFIKFCNKYSVKIDMELDKYHDDQLLEVFKNLPNNLCEEFKNKAMSFSYLSADLVELNKNIITLKMKQFFLTWAQKILDGPATKNKFDFMNAYLCQQPAIAKINVSIRWREVLKFPDLFDKLQNATQIFDKKITDVLWNRLRFVLCACYPVSSNLITFFGTTNYYRIHNKASFIFSNEIEYNATLAENEVELVYYLTESPIFFHDYDESLGKIYKRLKDSEDEEFFDQWLEWATKRKRASDIPSKIAAVKQTLAQLYEIIRSDKTGTFKEIPVHQFVNFYFNILLNFFCIRTKQEIKDPNKFIYFGEEKIWPLENTNLESCEKFLWYALLAIEYGEKKEIRNQILESYIQILDKILEKGPDQFSQKMRALVQDLLDGTKRIVFVGMKGIKEEDYVKIKDTIKKDLPHFVATEAILEKNFDELSLIKALAPVSGMIASIDPESKSDALTNFKQQTATIIENYMNIPDSMIPFVYAGGEQKIRAQNALPEMESGQAKDLCQALGSIPQTHLFKRLLDLTIDDLRERASEQYQESDLAVGTLYVPSMLFNSPLSALSKLLAELKPCTPVYALEVVKTIIENSTNEKELLFTTNLLLHESNLKILQEKSEDKQKDLVGAIKFICKKFIPQKIDKESILDAYERCRKFSSVTDKISYFAQKQEVQVINDYLRNVLDPGKIAVTNFVFNNEFFAGTPDIDILVQLASGLSMPMPVLLEATSVPEFSLKQLINAHVAGRGIVDLLKANELEKARPIIRKANKHFDIGKITQSVEFGSEREPIHATLIECLQNSVDIIRDFITKIGLEKQYIHIISSGKKDLSEDEKQVKESFEGINKSYVKRIERLGKPEAINQLGRIEYTLELMRIGESRASFCLTIFDHIAFPSLKQLLADFMLPDYSAKSPELGNVGDMGNGTFKIYQHATKVLLLTRILSDPNKVYLLIIRPMRSATTNLIEDLNWDCFDVSTIIEKLNPTFFGTSFKIIFEEKDKVEAQSDYLSAKNFLFECMSSVDVDLDLVEDGKLKLILKEPGQMRQINELNTNKIYVHPFQIMNPEAQEVFKRKNKRAIKDMSTHLIFKISQRPNKFMQSYLTTGGIPFKSLGSVLDAEKLLPPEFAANLRYGYIVDLALSTYEPVQSRTKLKMDEALKSELRRALFEFYFVRGIMLACNEETSKEFLSTHFTHFESKEPDIGQLRLGDATCQDFQIFYNAFLHEKLMPKKLTEKDFFDFYQSIWFPQAAFGPKSLHDFIEQEINAPGSSYKQLEQEKLKLEAQTKLEFDKFVRDCRTRYLADPTKINITDDEYREISEAFQQMQSVYSKSWEKFRDQKTVDFNDMVGGVTKSIMNPINTEFVARYITPFFEKIIAPWFTKKFKTKELTLKKLSDLTQVEPRFKTAKMQGAEQAVAASVAKNIMPYVAQGKELDAMKEFFVKGHVQSFLNYILYQYMICFFNSLSASHPVFKAPAGAIFAYEENNTALGYYSQAKSKIVINLKHYNLSELLDFAGSLFRFCIGKEESLKRVMKTKLYQDVFDETMKGSNLAVLPHELEHARRNDSTCQGFHTDKEAPDGQRINFNACARAWMTKAVENGFKTAWYEEVKKSAASSAAGMFKEFLTEDSKQKEWHEFLKSFKELEKIKPNIAKELGF